MRHLTLAALALAACSSAQQPAAPASATSNRANLPGTAPKPFTMATIGKFDSPFALAFLPNGALLVTEKAGALKLRRVDGSVGVIAGTPAVAAQGQGGLLDVAVAPDFASSRTIYLSYAEPRPTGSSLALLRATLDGDKLTGARVIWRAGSDGKGGQFGATITFAPDGKSLFLASGERQRFTPAQDPDQALGKIVRLTLDGQPWPANPGAGKVGAASVGVIDPPRNTGAAKGASVRSLAVEGPNRAPAATWSSGHRNPYGLAFDGAGRLWEVEMGPKGGDELNLILPGRNYGWPLASDGDNYDGSPIADHRPGDGFEAPKAWWNPSISPGGMMIYSGALFPQWRGSAFIAALGAQSLIRVALEGDRARAADQWDMGERLRDVAQAPDGSIWVLQDGGALVRLTPAGRQL